MKLYNDTSWDFEANKRLLIQLLNVYSTKFWYHRTVISQRLHRVGEATSSSLRESSAPLT